MFRLILLTYIAVVSAKSTLAQGSISYGSSQSGYLSSGGRHPWTFYGSAGDVITVDLVSSDFDAYLELSGPGGSQPTTDDDGGDGLNSQIASFRLTRTGTHTIVARALGNSGSGSYQLYLNGRRGPTVSAGPTTVNRGPIRNNQSLNGQLTAGAVDLYTFSGTAGQTASATLSHRSGDGFDPYLELVSPSGQTVATNDDGNGYPNSLIDRVRLTSSGTYTLRARDLGNDSAGNYTVGLRLDGMPTPTPTPRTYTGRINSGGQRSYSVEGRAGETVTIDLESSAFDAEVSLLSPHGNEVARDDDGGDGLNSRIERHYFTETGTYEVIVESHSSGGYGDFVLRVAR